VRRPAAVVLALFALAGCGGESGTSNPGEALSQTAAKLGEIRSGTLRFKLAVEPREEGGDFGFELSGPFQLGEPGALPVARIDYTQTAGDERETVTLTSTGERAFVTVDGTAYELPPDRADELREAGEALGGDGGGSGGLEELKIDDWIVEAESSDGGDVGGADTDKIEAELDVVAAVNDLIELSGGVGGPDLDPVEGPEAEQLRDAVKDAKLEVWTGDDDRLLRRLRLEADFDPSLPEGLEELARAAGSKVLFELEIDGPNERVEVEQPEDPRPPSEFPGG
jgi:hypothetical protein